MAIEVKKEERFVPDGRNIHMPRHEFLRLLYFNSADGKPRCHICAEAVRLRVDHNHRYPNLIRGLLCDDCNIEVGKFEHGHYNREMFDAIKLYLDNPPALQLGILRHYQAYYPEQNESEKTA